MIRPMTIDDLDEIIRLENSCFATPWSKEAFEKEIVSNQLANYLVIIHDGEIAGYCGVWYIIDEGHITNIAISPKQRRKGLGKLLVEEMIRKASLHGIEHMTLEVRKSNQPAIGLYETIGFEVAGVRPKYYTDNQEDALIMWMNLID